MVLRAGIRCAGAKTRAALTVMSSAPFVEQGSANESARRPKRENS